MNESINKKNIIDVVEIIFDLIMLAIDCISFIKDKHEA